jgi:hypothetical protein
MALTVSISISQNAGIPSQFIISDTSTGSDPGITERRVYLYNSANGTLVNDGTATPYTLWPIADATITMDVLDRDMALTVIVQWVTGSTVTYTYTNYYSFTAYTRTFLYNLSNTQSSNPAIINSTNYFGNKAIVWVCVSDSDNAVQYGDIQSAQLALDLAYYYIINASKFF